MSLFYFSIIIMVAMDTGHFLKMLNDTSTRILDVEGPGMHNLHIVGTLMQGWTQNPCLAAALNGICLRRTHPYCNKATSYS